jgi:CubicO group peptidase (beta-lactamase class C family)
MNMNKLILFFASFLFSSIAASQASPPLSSPASVFRNIEDMAVKVRLQPAENQKQLIKKKASLDIEAIATNHLSLPGNVGLVLVDSGNVVYEGYSKGATDKHRFVSFSMAKSLVSLSIGEAICAGKINSIDDIAEKYASELIGTNLGKTSIKNLLAMSSGVQTAQSHHGQPYYNATHELLIHQKSMSSIIKNYDNSRNKTFLGTSWNYSNLDTDALFFVLKGATNNKFSDFFKETVVNHAGLADNSYWAIDKENNEITHSFYFATLQDWTRIALYIRDILKNKPESCMGNFLKEATTKQSFARSNEFSNYGYQFFVNSKSTFKNDFWMVGFAGQRIGFDMQRDKIILNFSWNPNPENVYYLFKNM